MLRDRLLRALTLFGITLVLITEALSVGHSIRPAPLAVCWIAAVTIALLYAARLKPPVRFAIPGFDPVVAVYLAGITAILALTAVAAAFSRRTAPMRWLYHMPRVVYWAEQGSVRFFPTAYCRLALWNEWDGA